MAGGRNVQVIAIARSMLLEGRSQPSASRPSLRRKIASKTHSVIYQNNAGQLIYRAVPIDIGLPQLLIPKITYSQAYTPCRTTHRN